MERHHRINIAKISVLSKTIYRLGVIPIKFPSHFFHRNRKKNYHKEVGAWAGKTAQWSRAPAALPEI